jgi:hypothetical protein
MVRAVLAALRHRRNCDSLTVYISSAAIHRMMTHPDARPATIAPDFTNLVIAQTGDEWSTTGELVDIGNHRNQNLLNASDQRRGNIERACTQQDPDVAGRTRDLVSPDPRHLG